MTQIREDLKLKEAKKEAEAKKRGQSLFIPAPPTIVLVPLMHNALPEKVEEAKAKAAVKAQIEADKKARQEKAAREKALRDAGPGGIPMQPAEVAGPSSAAATPVASGAKKDYKEARLQIRLSTGGTYTTTIPAEGSRFYSSTTLAHSDRLG